jgi:hypothetical protein
VALDTAKLRNAVAIADAGRNGEIRYLGEFDNTEAATRQLVTKLASLHRKCAAAFWGTADQISSRRDFLSLTQSGRISAGP